MATEIFYTRNGTEIKVVRLRYARTGDAEIHFIPMQGIAIVAESITWNGVPI